MEEKILRKAYLYSAVILMITAILWAIEFWLPGSLTRQFGIEAESRGLVLLWGAAICAGCLSVVIAFESWFKLHERTTDNPTPREAILHTVGMAFPVFVVVDMFAFRFDFGPSVIQLLSGAYSSTLHLLHGTLVFMGVAVSILALWLKSKRQDKLWPANDADFRRKEATRGRRY